MKQASTVRVQRALQALQALLQKRPLEQPRSFKPDTNMQGNSFNNFALAPRSTLAHRLHHLRAKELTMRHLTQTQLGHGLRPRIARLAAWVALIVLVAAPQVAFASTPRRSQSELQRNGAEQVRGRSSRPAREPRQLKSQRAKPSVPWYRKGLSRTDSARFRRTDAPKVTQSRRAMGPMGTTLPARSTGPAKARKPQQLKQPSDPRQCPFGRCTGDMTIHYAPLLSTQPSGTLPTASDL